MRPSPARRHRDGRRRRRRAVRAGAGRPTPRRPMPRCWRSAGVMARRARPRSRIHSSSPRRATPFRGSERPALIAPWPACRRPVSRRCGRDSGDRDTRRRPGPPPSTWITVAEQRRALATAFAHHTRVASLARIAADPCRQALAGQREGRPALMQAAAIASQVVDGRRTSQTPTTSSSAADDGGVPPGMRAGDVVVAWPRSPSTLWRDGRRRLRSDAAALRLPHSSTSAPAPAASRSSARSSPHDLSAPPAAAAPAIVARGTGPRAHQRPPPRRAERRSSPNVPIHDARRRPRASCTPSAARAPSSTSASCSPSPHCSSPSPPRSTTRSAGRSRRRSSTGSRRR